jgi:serine/threonine protein kinase
MAMILRKVGRYELLKEIGRGGMAAVYLARQTDLDRLVALKELASLHQSDEAFAERFLRESRMAGSLSHPNIVTVHDYFEHDGTPYIAMEYVERGSLRPFVGRMTFAQIGGVLEGLLSGLQHAASRGIVHRDMKPENVMVTEEGSVKISDFGIGRAVGQTNASKFLTATGTAIGTPAYMAPEQAMAKEVGPWTDLYSLGIMAYEMILGDVPFSDSDTPMSMLIRHVSETIPPPKVVDPSIDPQLSDWLERILQKEPEARPKDAQEAWDRLEEVVIRLLGPRWRREARLLDRATDEQESDERPLTPAPFSEERAKVDEHEPDYVTFTPPGGPESPSPPPPVAAAPGAPPAPPPLPAPEQGTDAGEDLYLTFAPGAGPREPTPAGPPPPPPVAEPPAAPVAGPGPDAELPVPPPLVTSQPPAVAAPEAQLPPAPPPLVTEQPPAVAAPGAPLPPPPPLVTAQPPAVADPGAQLPPPPPIVTAQPPAVADPAAQSPPPPPPIVTEQPPAVAPPAAPEEPKEKRRRGLKRPQLPNIPQVPAELQQFAPGASEKLAEAQAEVGSAPGAVPHDVPGAALDALAPEVAEAAAEAGAVAGSVPVIPPAGPPAAAPPPPPAAPEPPPPAAPEPPPPAEPKEVAPELRATIPPERVQEPPEGKPSFVLTDAVKKIEQRTAEPKGRIKPVWIIAAVVVLAAGGGAFALLSGGGGKSNGQTTQTTQQTTTHGTTPGVVPDVQPSRLQAMSLALSNTSLYVASPGGALARLSPQLKQQALTTDPNGPRAIAVAQGKLYAVDGKTFDSFDARTLQQLSSVSLPGGSGLAGGVSNPLGVIQSRGKHSGTLCLLAPGSSHLGPCEQLSFDPTGIGVEVGSGVFYVADGAAGTVVPYDSRGMKLRAEKPIRVGKSPAGGLTAHAGRLYVPIRGGVAVVDMARGKLSSTISLPASPTAAWIVPAAGGRLFAMLYGSDRIAVIDLADPGKPALVTGIKGPVAAIGKLRGVGQVYVVGAAGDTVATLDDRTGALIHSTNIDALGTRAAPIRVLTPKIAAAGLRVTVTIPFASGSLPDSGLSGPSGSIASGKATLELAQGGISSRAHAASGHGVTVSVSSSEGKLEVELGARAGDFADLSVAIGKGGKSVVITLTAVPATTTTTPPVTTTTPPVTTTTPPVTTTTPPVTTTTPPATTTTPPVTTTTPPATTTTPPRTTTTVPVTTTHTTTTTRTTTTGGFTVG